MATLRALECLVAVLEAGSITEAAARLHMSQPALSHQLTALEREIGTAVVQRLPRGVRSTAAGRAIEADARAALLAADRAVQAGRAVAAGVDGQLRIACAESMTASLVAPVLRAWRRRRPRIRVALTEAASADTLASLVDLGQADLAIGPRPSRTIHRVHVVGEEEIVVALPSDDVLSTARALTFAQLDDLPIVHFHPDNGLGPWLDGAAAQHGVTLTATVRTRQATTAAQLAAAGIGVALVPTTAVPASYPGALRPLRPRLTREVVTITACPDDPLVAAFDDDIRRQGVPVPSAVATKLTRSARTA